MMNKKELVYQDTYVTRYYYPECEILAEYWNDTTADMTDEEFIIAEEEFANAFIKYKPKKIFCQLQKFQYSITPEVQDWIREYVAKIAVNNGARHKADVFSLESFEKIDINRLSVELLMDDVVTEMPLTYRVFKEEEEAMQWLINV